MLFLGSDHAGFELKKQIEEYLNEIKVDFVDCGCYTAESCDYPVQAYNTCKKLKKGDLAILVCGTGIGISIAANKIKGIRAACCSESFSAKYSRMHNDANVLCLGGRVIDIEKAKEIVDVFLNTEPVGGRHSDRLKMITEIENGAFENNN